MSRLVSAKLAVAAFAVIGVHLEGLRTNHPATAGLLVLSTALRPPAAATAPWGRGGRYLIIALLPAPATALQLT